MDIIKSMKNVELDTEIVSSLLNIKNFRDDLLSFCCNRNYQKMFDKDLNKPFDNTYKFSFFFF